MNSILILSLTLSLGSPAWAEREAAHALLAQHVSAATPILLWGEQHHDTEIAVRCSKLLAGHHAEKKAAKHKQRMAALLPKGGHWPPIHAQPHSWWYGEICSTFNAAARDATQSAWDDEPTAQLAMQLYCEWLLLDCGYEDDSVRRIVTESLEREAYFSKNGRYPDWW